MSPVGFTAQPPKRRFASIWVVLFTERRDPAAQPRIAGAFPAEGEALSLVEELRGLEGSKHLKYSVQPGNLYARVADWVGDDSDIPAYDVGQFDD